MQHFKVSKSRTRKWFIVAAIIVVVCAIAFGVIYALVGKEWLAQKVANADVDIVGISLKDISLTTVTVDVTVRVHNSEPVGGVLDRIAYDIYFEADGKWVKLGDADRAENVMVKANSSATFDIINEIGTLPAIAALYQVYDQGGSATLKVTGSAWVGIGPVSTEIPFERIENVGF